MNLFGSVALTERVLVGRVFVSATFDVSMLTTLVLAVVVAAVVVVVVVVVVGTAVVVVVAVELRELRVVTVVMGFSANHIQTIIFTHIHLLC